MFKEYDVVVVGGGHAGCEAAMAAERLGCSVLLITMNTNTIAHMSCNPAMGGVAKGQILREIDALGGWSAIVSDRSMIQFRMLNRSKGPAMWSPRSQNDRWLFAYEWRKVLESAKGLDMWQDMVTSVILKGKQVIGVKTQRGHSIYGKSVVLTNGTFLNGIIHIGEKKFGGGRTGERASSGITEQLIELGFESGRMKTGTPPRIDGRSIDYDRVAEQPGDEDPGKFSFTETAPLKKQRSCLITYTNQEVHDIMKEGFDYSPMFTGRIKGVGPRYCPSLEDKINRFAERDRHQIFLEPEGWDTEEVYVNGFSTSLPEEIQMRAMKRVVGLENVVMIKPGYAIEYDYFPPTQLEYTLETKPIANLFFAGQINGTTGYEEAGCQGLLAGINAANKVQNKESFQLQRDNAYMGVLVDDLINKGTDEPYRMFTSRAEYRILLRQDNADQRLTPIAKEIGMVSEERFEGFQAKMNRKEKLAAFLKVQTAEVTVLNAMLSEFGSKEVNQKTKLDKLLLRPELSLSKMAQFLPELSEMIKATGQEESMAVEVEMKYGGYIQKEKEQAEKVMRLEKVRLHKDFRYNDIKALSSEARDKLTRLKPGSLGQASRISGVSPADISVLMVHLGR